MKQPLVYHLERTTADDQTFSNASKGSLIVRWFYDSLESYIYICLKKYPGKKTLTFNPFDLLAKKTEMNGQKRHFFLPEKKIKIFLLIVLSSLANILHIVACHNHI